MRWRRLPHRYLLKSYSREPKKHCSSLERKELNAKSKSENCFSRSRQWNHLLSKPTQNPPSNNQQCNKNQENRSRSYSIEKHAPEPWVINTRENPNSNCPQDKSSPGTKLSRTIGDQSRRNNSNVRRPMKNTNQSSKAKNLIPLMKKRNLPRRATFSRTCSHPAATLTTQMGRTLTTPLTSIKRWATDCSAIYPVNLTPKIRNRHPKKCR